VPKTITKNIQKTQVKQKVWHIWSPFGHSNPSLHPSLTFTMELPVDDRNLFIGIEIIKNRTKLGTQVYRKATNTGLLLHFHSHTDKRYKDSLLKTMLLYIALIMLYLPQQRLLTKNVPNCAPFLVVLITVESYRVCYFQFCFSKPFSMHSREEYY